MEFINLHIDQSYLEKAASLLGLTNFPSTNVQSKLIDAIGGSVEHSQKMQSMIDWIDLIEKKYRETITSVVYGMAHFIKQQEEGFISPSQPFYVPSTSYFTENAVTRSFSLAEKLAQLINVFEEIGDMESGHKKSVSFSKIREKTEMDLSDLHTSLSSLTTERHAHTHGMTPEITRHKISDVQTGSINGGPPVAFIFRGIDETKLPVTPYQQLIRCKEVMDKFAATISKILDEIEQDLKI